MMMADGGSLINLGDLSKPATVLVEKIAEAVGGVFRPRQIVRVARAEAEAEIIRAEAQIEIEGIERRAFYRFLHEETQKQKNIESITQMALPLVAENAAPENMESDWIANFFDKCRLVSDEAMQQLWARILAGEANFAGTFSKRTIAIVASLDKEDADLFKRLCSFCWVLDRITPLVYDEHEKIYEDSGVTFMSLQHLESIGLVQFGHVSGFQRLRLPKTYTVYYFGRKVELHLANDDNNDLPVGKVLLTQAGYQLAPIAGAVPSEAVFRHAVAHFETMGTTPVLLR